MAGCISAELVRRAARLGYCGDTLNTLQVLGTAVDAGLIELGELLDLVRSCATADQLGDALTMVAATVQDDDPLPVGYPPAPAGRFRIVGELEEGVIWTR